MMLLEIPVLPETGIPILLVVAQSRMDHLVVAIAKVALVEEDRRRVLHRQAIALVDRALLLDHPRLALPTQAESATRH